MLLINSLNFNTFYWEYGFVEKMRGWTITLQLGLFCFSFEKLSKNIWGNRGKKILFYSNSIIRYRQVRIRENVLFRYIKDRREGHLWTVIQAGIRRSVSRLLKISPEPPKEKKMKKKTVGMWSLLELNLTQSSDRSLKIAAPLQAAMHHRLTAVCFSSKRRGTHRTACARLPPPL